MAHQDRVWVLAVIIGAMLEQRIQQHFIDSADLKYQAAPLLSKPIADAVQALLACVTSGGKVLACGNGGSAADAQHFAAEFVGRFERERPELAAIALTTDSSILTAIGNDYDFNSIFSKQVQAIGAPGDVLLAISTSGNSANVVAAVEAAHAKEMTVIALTAVGAHPQGCADPRLGASAHGAPSPPQMIEGWSLPASRMPLAVSTRMSSRPPMTKNTIRAKIAGR